MSKVANDLTAHPFSFHLFSLPPIILPDAHCVSRAFTKCKMLDCQMEENYLIRVGFKNTINKAIFDIKVHKNDIYKTV
jgi:hypothetical protein